MSSLEYHEGGRHCKYHGSYEQPRLYLAHAHPGTIFLDEHYLTMMILCTYSMFICLVGTVRQKQHHLTPASSSYYGNQLFLLL